MHPYSHTVCRRYALDCFLQAPVRPSVWHFRRCDAMLSECWLTVVGAGGCGLRPERGAWLSSGRSPGLAVGAARPCSTSTLMARVARASALPRVVVSAPAAGPRERAARRARARRRGAQPADAHRDAMRAVLQRLRHYLRPEAERPKLPTALRRGDRRLRRHVPDARFGGDPMPRAILQSGQP